MKKSFLSIMMGLLILGISWNAWAAGPITPPAPVTPGVTATDVVCTECVDESDIAPGVVTEPKLATGAVTTNKVGDGAITNDKLADWSVNSTKIVDFSITDAKISSNAVSTTKIADGAVTDVKISGPISGAKLGVHTHSGSDITDGTITASKISDGEITDAKITGPISAAKLEKPANVVIVAKSGGDFTSIQAAIDSINPTADNPYLIKVMPGRYVESITTKSYIYLQGSGREVTTIESSGGNVISNQSGNVVITDFTLTGGAYGINNESSIVVKGTNISGNGRGGIINWGGSWALIEENNITSNGGYGIYNVYRTSPIIKRNTISGNGYGGIENQEFSSPDIEDNIINGNGGVGINNAINCSPKISGNTISGNSIGITAFDNSFPRIVRNWITDNGSYDIFISSSSIPTVSFNVYNTIYGTNGVGMYNVKSDGTPAIEP